MHRRDFLKLTPAATATLTLTTPGAPGTPPIVEPFDVGVLRLEPGDVLVLTTPGCISIETAERIKAHVERELLPLGVKAWIMGDGLTVAGVLRGRAGGAGGGDRGGGKG